MPADAPVTATPPHDRSRPGVDRSAVPYRPHLLGAAFPLGAGMALYGWRAAMLAATLLVSTALAVYIWRRVGARGAIIRYPRALWLALVLAMMLPPHLMVGQSRPPLQATHMMWVILPAAGLLLAVFLWMTAGTRWPTVHPLLLTYLTLVICYSEALTPRVILHPARLAVGDVMDVDTLSRIAPATADPWFKRADQPSRDALYHPIPAAQHLAEYTRGLPRQRAPMAMEAMLRDYMPPLEDLVIGGHPGPIGSSSAIAVIIGGLVLLYFGLIDHRVPLIIVVVVFTGFALLPSLAMQGAQVDWAASVTFANYEIMASPLLLVAFFLATHPEFCPAARKPRTIYALLVGLLTIACQLYLSVAYGPYMALGLASLLTPWLEQGLQHHARS